MIRKFLQVLQFNLNAQILLLNAHRIRKHLYRRLRIVPLI